jgi:hypothetical protein
LIAGIIGLGLVGLCLRTVPTVLTETTLMAQIAEPLTGIPADSPSSLAPVNPKPSMSIDPTTATQPSVRPAKLQAKRKLKSQDHVRVPENGPGTIREPNKRQITRLLRRLDPLRRPGGRRLVRRSGPSRRPDSRRAG